MGKSCRPEKINMRVTTSQYEIYLISGQNSHLPSQNVFLQNVMYSTERAIIFAWGKSRVFSTDPPFLHRRDNNDCRPLSGTWRTLYINKHLINKAVGRTQKTSFPLSSISKASLCCDFKTNPSSCASKSRPIDICHFTAKALEIYSSRVVRNIANELVEKITCQLVDSLHLNLANRNCPRLKEAGNSNENNLWKIFSVPSLALRFQPRSRPFVWLLARTWIRKNTDCFAVYLSRWGRLMSKWLLSTIWLLK